MRLGTTELGTSVCLVKDSAYKKREESAASLSLVRGGELILARRD